MKQLKWLPLYCALLCELGGSRILLSRDAPAAQENRNFRPEPKEIDPVIERKALVIGNASYRQALLKNPGNDAVDMQAALERLGFTVTLARDLTRRRMDEVTAKFAHELGRGVQLGRRVLAFFYYSGHGLQVERTNYLVPVDYQAGSAADVRYEAFPADQILERIEKSGATVRVMVLDACRDNPFRAVRGGDRGLAPMTSYGEGTLIVYATAENETADDNPAERNGLYTKCLLDALRTPCPSLKGIFDSARNSVWALSGKKQLSYVYDGLIGDVSLGLDCIAPPSSSKKQGKSGLDYVRIPPGRARIGCVPQDKQCAKDEKPRHDVIVDAFWITTTEVTYEAYTQFAAKNRRAWKQSGLVNKNEKDVNSVPMTRVTWEEANAYCKWEGEGGRLPTEAEWEYAARGGMTGQIFPWGNTFQPERANAFPYTSGYGLVRVGRFPPNAFGLYDVIGNAREWTNDFYAMYPAAGEPVTNPAGPDSGKEKVIRGGSFYRKDKDLRLSARERHDPTKHDNETGFRCRIPDPPPPPVKH